MAVGGWEFWELTNASTGALVWLGASRPGGRSAIDRQKIWTLIPGRRTFIANWFVTVDHLREEDGIWVHENIDVVDARNIVLDVTEPSQADLDRIVRSEELSTLDQIDRFTVAKVMGGRADSALENRG